jgi:cytidine deaminase
VSDPSDSAAPDLLARAWRARRNAYAPYSEFAVGAAVLAGSGKVYVGANVENASYGLTTCAERVAIFSAIAAGETEIRRVAVVADTPHPISPCGACRQVIREFGPRATIVAENRAGDRHEWTISELLPEAFEFSREDQEPPR